MFTRLYKIPLVVLLMSLWSFSAFSTEFIEIYLDKDPNQYFQHESASFSIIERVKPIGPHQRLVVEAFFPDEQNPVILIPLGTIKYFITDALPSGLSRFTAKVYFEEDSFSPELPSGKRKLVQTKTVTINARALSNTPIANMVVTPNFGEAPVQVTLDASGSSDPQGLSLIFEYDFGDGTYSGPTTDNSLNHTYQNEGSFVAAVTVKNSSGLSSVATTVVTVSAPPERLPPFANLVVTTDSEDLEILVDASGSVDPQGSALTYSYDFGDGSQIGPISSPLNYHTYTSPGEYVVTLTVENSFLLSSTTTATIVVGEASPPEAPQEPSPGQLSLAGVNITGFNSITSVPKIVILNESFSTKRSDYTIFLNDALVPLDEQSVSSTEILLFSSLREGENEIRVYGVDSVGRTIKGFFKFVAGSKTITLKTVDSVGSVLANSNLKVSIPGYEQSINDTTDAAGTLTIHGIPKTSLISVSGDASTNSSSTVLEAGENARDIVLTSVGEPTTPNLYYSDLSGWDLSSGQVAKVPKTADLSNYLFKPKYSISLAERKRRNFDRIPSSSPRIQGEDCYYNCTLLISTAGVGEKTTTHTFVATEKNLKVNYRFKTLEIFNGYVDPMYDDYYTISYKTSSGKTGIVSNSLSSLTRDGFDFNGVSDWMTFSIDNQVGDIVEIKASVTNMGDDLYDSLLQLDHIVRSEVLAYGTLDSSISAISIGSHSYFDGYTRIPAYVKIEGEPGSFLGSVTPRIFVNGMIFDGEILTSSIPLEWARFPGSGIIESYVVFQFISPSSLALTKESNVYFSYLVTSGYDSASFIFGKFPPLVSKTLSSHNGIVTAVDGGNDWIHYRLDSQIEKISEVLDSKFTYLSHMNGGLLGMDGTEFGTAVEYSPSWYKMNLEQSEAEVINNAARRSAAANRIIGLINDPIVGKGIKCIWVDGRFYKETGSQTDPFWIQLLNDSATAEVVRPNKKSTQKIQIIL